MKKLISYCCFVGIIASCQTISAQGLNGFLEKPHYNLKANKSLNNNSEDKAINTATVPDFKTKPNKLKITGTIFENDGVTPANNVVFTIFQADEDGNYEMKRDANRKRYVYHRAEITTKADGKYTFYTFMPGRFLHTKELINIHREIKEPGKDTYKLDAFFFNNDPLFLKLIPDCRRQLANSTLKVEKKDGMYIAKKDIVLEQNTASGNTMYAVTNDLRQGKNISSDK
tara:strand:- start:15859 stop:16542 length:684 start_codon:yes stop_codon:yes gene_type:complete